ncbi:MAG: pyruvate, phosphate dikinase [Clostridia bacterium]|nr:pyruvate, phosphate dikinase [Clostridia bacterium]MDD4686283.1 pyruvate, phosphate dikinase [Clostridia bacterium]
MSKKYVYLFKEGNASMRNLLGGKGANLCEMTRLGLPVPSGFVVSTSACMEFNKNQTLREKIEKQIFNAIKKIEKLTGKSFGNAQNTLILAVRSGARISMPGMMDTILNLGLNDEIVEGIASQYNPRFAYDSYRRFIQMYSNVAKGIKIEEFENLIDVIKQQENIILDKDLTTENFKDLIKLYKKIYKKNTGEEFPQDVKIQLMEAVNAVFGSWFNQRAVLYRRINNIPDDWGTAVNVQSMTFGNLDEHSGTGVAFTRNPSTGENKMYGEFIMNAQGEDVVAGIRTPLPIEKLKEENEEIYNEFVGYATKLENYFKDMQDMEFTIQSGKLYILQTRNGKRTPTASLKIAVDLVKEGKINEKEALLRLEPNKLNSLLHPIFNEAELKKRKPIASGLPASPGGAFGKIAFSVEKVIELKKENQKAILVRLETSPEDIEAMTISEGILTARGGMTSHAAVVARGMGKVSIVGCENLKFVGNKIKLGQKLYQEGDILSLDGTTGNIYENEISLVPSNLTGDFSTVMQWVEKHKVVKVFANADTPQDVKEALKVGAEGIGLCRTEHMFFQENRINIMREMILADTLQEREKALKKLLKFQKKDFIDIFKEMKEKPVTIRLLDPPLHEFLPKNKQEIENLAVLLNKTQEDIQEKVVKLHEFNPMLGHRGLRIAVTYPEIYQMQTRAIIEAGIEVKTKYDINSNIEIMIPLTICAREFLHVKKDIKETANEIIKSANLKLNYKIGAMIETPRASLLADEFAGIADFFSFGTNDLTQLVYAFSRDDSEKFLDDYYEKNIFKINPFDKIDEKGVGKLMKYAIKNAKKVNPDLKIGVCGEHGGEADSIDFFVNLGISYVSCSPFRVPIAKLACTISSLKIKN